MDFNGCFICTNGEPDRPLGLDCTRVAIIRDQFSRVDPTQPHWSLQNLFLRLHRQYILWEYRLFRGTFLGSIGRRPGTADLGELTKDFTDLGVHPQISPRTETEPSSSFEAPNLARDSVIILTCHLLHYDCMTRTDDISGL